MSSVRHFKYESSFFYYDTFATENVSGELAKLDVY